MMRRAHGPAILFTSALTVVLVATAVVAIRPANASGAPTAEADQAGGTGSFVLTATNTGPTYAPTFTGNGRLGLRVPPAGQGYANGAVPTSSELAGFYAQSLGGVQQRATIPTWSTLAFSDGGQAFSLGSGRTDHWRQSINFRTGIIATSARWTAPNGHVTDVSTQVLTDRARGDIGLVRLTVMPHWTGRATVTDAVDGSPANLSSQTGKGWVLSAHRDWVSFQALGTGIKAAIASQLGMSGNVKAATGQVDQTTDQSVGQQLGFEVAAGHSYTVTKYVGVVTSRESGAPAIAAQAEAGAAATAGFNALVAENDARWATLWSGRIDVLGNPVLATEVNASEFYLWSSTRQSVDWSISPAGLSSNGYNGHIFWDAETWMYPALLAQHPDLASGMNTYRFERLTAARDHAVATGYQGGRYPWESALDGSEQIPPPASLFTEGLYEQHVTADIALAQWQYYQATGDKSWLRQRGWPVISAAASFWVSRAMPVNGDGYHIDGVTGPDEENADVNDETYTNAAAVTTLRDAVQAASVLGMPAPASWARTASGIVVPTDGALGINPEFSGYAGQLIKQADATLLQYPLGYAIPSNTAQSNVDYYAPRTDPSGPSMSDAINSIDTSALGTAGCAGYVYVQRSVQPFIRDTFDQFSETRSGGAFTFVTGIGGFLQEFLYGYSGLRWNADHVDLSPSLSSQLSGVVLHDMRWHGRRFMVTIGQHDTVVVSHGGGVLPVKAGPTIRTIGSGGTLSFATHRPDLATTTNGARCGNASATSSQPGAPALAAVDGSPATEWQPSTVPAALTVPLSGGNRTITNATLTWGQRWPPMPTPVAPPPPGPVTSLKAASYTLAVSTDGSVWTTVATGEGRGSGSIDSLSFPAVKARFIRVSVTSSATGQPPALAEVTVSG